MRSLRSLLIAAVIALLNLTAPGCQSAGPCQSAGALHAAPTAHGALANPTGRPIGGGEQYGEWIDGQVVSTRAELLAALKESEPGAVVYVDDDAAIDLTGCWNVQVGAGVTLAGGRGRNGSPGGLLYTRAMARVSLLQVKGEGARITGLRIAGPHARIAPEVWSSHDPIGIEIASRDHARWRVQIDNNEMWGWPRAAVSVDRVTGVHVHHNHLHHNRRRSPKTKQPAPGRGYGVVTDVGWVRIEANLFEQNRHDIACTGRPGSSYEACYNLVLGGAVRHSFDVHGGRDRGDGTDIAGDVFFIHHNTFIDAGEPAIRIRGIPQEGAWIHHNAFRHGSIDEAVRQENARGNIFLEANVCNIPEQVSEGATGLKDSGACAEERARARG